MTILPLTTAKSNLNQLLTPTNHFVFREHSPDEIVALCKDMIESLYHYNGLGISANQLGIQHSIFAMRGDPEDFVLFNPRIVYHSPDLEVMDEGCLSWPELRVKMKRAKEIRMRFANPHGEMMSHTFKNITARVVQHEMQHLAGLQWFEGCSRLQLEPAIRRAKNKGFDYSGMGLMKHAKSV